jgi:hypothetical protein
MCIGIFHQLSDDMIQGYMLVQEQNDHVRRDTLPSWLKT